MMRFKLYPRTATLAAVTFLGGCMQPPAPNAAINDVKNGVPMCSNTMNGHRATVSWASETGNHSRVEFEQMKYHWGDPKPHYAVINMLQNLTKESAVNQANAFCNQGPYQP